MREIEKYRKKERITETEIMAYKKRERISLKERERDYHIGTERRRERRF